MAKEVKKRHKFLYKVCMLIAKKRFLKRYGLPDEPFDVKDKQVFIIGNHTTSMDGALLDIYFRRPIFLVTTEFTMSQGFKSWIFRYVFNPIPFAKGTSDMSSMKRLLTVVKEGGNIALYPEGNFSYNGLTGYIKPSIAKLVKSAKLPLYIVNTIGTYFENARWMVSKIYGPSKMIIRKVLYYDEYSKMSNEELLNIIRENLQVDHYAYQEKEMNKYVGKDRALGLERAVFACPKCGNLFSTYSEGNYLKCDKCSINYEYDEYGYLVESEDKKYSIKELAAFSIDKYLDYLYENIDNIQFSIRDNCQIYQAFPRKRILLGEGKFVMSAFAFTVAYGDTIHVIKYEDAFCAIEVKNKFTIGSDDKKYLLIFDNHVAVLKYLIAFQFFNYYANGKITPNYKDELWFGQ